MVSNDPAGTAAFAAILQQLISTGEQFMFEVTDDHRLHGSNGVFQRLMDETLDELKGRFTMSAMRPGETMDSVYPEVLALAERLRADASLPPQPLRPWWFKVSHEYWVQAGDGTMQRDMAPSTGTSMVPVLVVRGRILAFHLGRPDNVDAPPQRVIQPRLPGTGGDRKEVWCLELDALFAQAEQEERDGKRHQRDPDHPDKPTLGWPTLVRLAYETGKAQGTWQTRLKAIAELEGYPEETAKETLDRKYDEWQQDQDWSGPVKK